MKQTHITTLSIILSNFMDIVTEGAPLSHLAYEMHHDAQTILRYQEIRLGSATITDPAYFDCECEEEYIHRKGYGNNIAACPICGIDENGGPDSLISEVVALIVKKYQPLLAKVSHPS